MSAILLSAWKVSRKKSLGSDLIGEMGGEGVHHSGSYVSAITWAAKFPVSRNLVLSDTEEEEWILFTAE